MDSKGLQDIINRIPLLKYKYIGSVPADNIPRLQKNTFAIVNTDLSFEEGTHWILIANKNGKFYYADSMGQPLEVYENIKLPYKNIQRLVYTQLQNLALCGQYCIYFAWTIFSGTPIGTFFNDFDLMRFIFQYL